MRREMKKNKEEMNIKIIKYSGITIAILAVIVFGILIYSKKLNNDVKEGTLMSEQLSSILNNTNTASGAQNTESASTEIGKSVNEMSNELKQNNKNNTIVNNSSVNVNNTTAKTSESNNVLTTNKINTNNTTSQTNSKAEEKKENKNVELSFSKPVEGDIVRDFAVDNLIYSNTLQEWTTHTGIDIKADKTTVVKSAEAGTVKTIKNDPRNRTEPDFGGHIFLIFRSSFFSHQKQFLSTSGSIPLKVMLLTTKYRIPPIRSPHTTALMPRILTL